MTAVNLKNSVVCIKLVLSCVLYSFVNCPACILLLIRWPVLCLN